MTGLHHLVFREWGTFLRRQACHEGGIETYLLVLVIVQAFPEDAKEYIKERLGLFRRIQDDVDFRSRVFEPGLELLRTLLPLVAEVVVNVCVCDL